MCSNQFTITLSHTYIRNINFASISLKRNATHTENPRSLTKLFWRKQKKTLVWVREQKHVASPVQKIQLGKYLTHFYIYSKTSIAPLREHACSNILKIAPPKTESFQIKILIFFHISAQNIDCGYSLEPPRWGGSNEYPQAMFLSRNKKNNLYPCKPQFYYIKVGFKGVKII